MNFPSASELFCLFFDRFPEMRPTFFRQPHRLMLHVQMEMCCQMMPKRGNFDFSTKISPDAMELLSSVDDHAFVLVPCPYASLDW